MRFKFLTHKGLATACLIISVVLFLMSMLEIFSNNYTDNIAERTGKIVESRLEELEKLIKYKAGKGEQFTSDDIKKLRKEIN